MTAFSAPVPRIGRFLVELARLERAQPPGVFLVERLEATAGGVRLRQPCGVEVVVPVDAAAADIGEALRAAMPGLRIPAADEPSPISDEPDVQIQWAQLHSALGSYERAILVDADVRVLAVERHGTGAAVEILRGPQAIREVYSIDLDRMIDIGLADTLAFAPAFGRVGGSLNLP